MSELAAVFALGLLSSAHCLGMCGGFAAAIGATRQPLGPSLVRQMVYSFGRVTTYAFLGAVGGTAGLWLAEYNTSLVTVQQVFSILAGVMMLLIGASVLGLLRFTWWKTGALGQLLAPMFTHFLNARSWGGFYLAGLANGFLPCGLVYAFLAKAISTSALLDGALLMAAFGLGTVPAMVAIGCGSTLLGHAARRRVYQFAACIVMVFGVITIKRGLPDKDAPCCADPVATAHRTDRCASVANHSVVT